MGIPDRKDKIALIKALLAKGANVNAPAPKGLPATFGDRHATATPFSSRPAAGTPKPCNCCSTTARTRWRTAAAAAIHRAARRRAARRRSWLRAAGNVDTSVVIPEARRIEAIRLAIKAGVDVNAADEKATVRCMSPRRTATTASSRCCSRTVQI